MVSPLLCVHTILTHDYQALANTIVLANSFEVHVYINVCLVSTFEQSNLILVLGSRLIFNLYEAVYACVVQFFEFLKELSILVLWTIYE
jgi:hypothetical protein